MPDVVSSKSELRTLMRARRRQLDDQSQSRAATGLSQSVTQLPEWPQARSVALYLASDGEIQTLELARLARAAGKALLLPGIDAATALHFAYWEEGAELRRNRHGIGEPPPAATTCPPAAIDIICLPLVSWDRTGGRLGRGGGYYDRSLGGVCGPLLVGLAHSCQEVPEVPRESFDVLLDYVATERELIPCRARRNVSAGH